MEPIPVSNPASWWTTAGVWAGFFMLLGVIVRQAGPWRKQSIDAAQKIRDELMERVNTLEERSELTRKEADDKIEKLTIFYDTKIEKLTAAYDLKIEKLNASNDAVVAIMRHRVNNLTASLEALLMLLEQDPSKAGEAVKRIREMRGRQAREEATEKAALHAHKLAGVTGTFTVDEEDAA